VVEKGTVDEQVVYSEKIPVSRGYRFAPAGVIICFVAAGIVFYLLKILGPGGGDAGLLRGLAGNTGYDGVPP